MRQNPKRRRFTRPTSRHPSGRKTDSLEQAARRAQAAACVNNHPAFGKSFRQDALAKIALLQANPYLVHVIKAIGAEQDNSPPEPSGVADLAPFVSGEPAESAEDPEHSRRAASEAGNRKSEIENPKSEIQSPLLTPEEKRRILARIVRVNPLDCFDESGAFDIARAKRILPPGAVRSIAVHETTCLNAEGQPITERRINVRLVDPVSALRLDDQLERRRERTASTSSSATDSDYDSPPPHPASPEYAHNLLRQKTKGLDEAQHTLALLKKALAEREERKLQLSKELEKKNRQLSQTLSKVEGEIAQLPKEITSSSASQNSSSMALQNRDQSWEAGFSTPLSGRSKAQNASNPTLPSRDPSTKRDTGCQPVEPKCQTAHGQPAVPPARPPPP